MELLKAGDPARIPWRIAGRPPAPPALALAGLVVGAAVNLPLAYLFARAWGGGLTSWARAAFSASNLLLLAQTAALVAGVLALSLAIALPLAWLVVDSDLRGRRVWAVLGALPLVFPSYVSSFALVAVFGPKGFVQGWLEPLGVPRLPGIAYGYSGALLALALFTYPYLYLPLVAAWRSLDPAFEETARSLGSGRWRCFVHVTLPQLRGPILAGGLLVALYTVSDFGAVSVVRYNTLTVSIYNAYRSLFDRGVAASAATLLVLLALAIVVLQAAMLRRVRPRAGSTARARRPAALGRWHGPCLAALGLLFLLTLGMPVGVISFWALRALRVGHVLEVAGQAALHSTGVSLAAAVAAAILALPVAIWSVRHPSTLARGVERLSYTGFALPGLVIALALVFFATRHFRPLYQTLGLLVAAYVVRFLPEALSAARSAIAAVPPVLEDAGRLLGRTPLAVWRSVTLPLVRPGVLAGAGLVFLTSMKELPATLILRPVGFETLATRVWSAASEGIFSQAAVPALLLLVVSAPPVYWLAIRPALARRA